MPAISRQPAGRRNSLLSEFPQRTGAATPGSASALARGLVNELEPIHGVPGLPRKSSIWCPAARQIAENIVSRSRATTWGLSAIGALRSSADSVCAEPQSRFRATQLGPESPPDAAPSTRVAPPFVSASAKNGPLRQAPAFPNKGGGQFGDRCSAQPHSGGSPLCRFGNAIVPAHQQISLERLPPITVGTDEVRGRAGRLPQRGALNRSINAVIASLARTQSIRCVPLPAIRRPADYANTTSVCWAILVPGPHCDAPPWSIRPAMCVQDDAQPAPAAVGIYRAPHTRPWRLLRNRCTGFDAGWNRPALDHRRTAENALWPNVVSTRAASFATDPAPHSHSSGMNDLGPRRESGTRPILQPPSPHHRLQQVRRWCQRHPERFFMIGFDPNRNGWGST
ncbi:hypothetical protein FQR65_LT21005 [Abscondita terminalis]|nr:hypothetical protein FQR65_LT21005 [Abscondita terminalis]